MKKLVKITLAATIAALGIYWGEPANFLMLCLAGGVILKAIYEKEYDSVD